MSLFDMLNTLKGDQDFYKIFFPFIDNAPSLEPRHYYIQMDKPNLRSLFALKHPKVYEKVPGQQVDFNMMIRECDFEYSDLFMTMGIIPPMG